LAATKVLPTQDLSHPPRIPLIKWFLVGCVVGALYSCLPCATWNYYGPQSRLVFALLLPLMAAQRVFYWIGWRVILEMPVLTLGFGFIGFVICWIWHGFGLRWQQARWIICGAGLPLLALIAWAALSADKGGCEGEFYSVAPNGDLLTAIGLIILLAGWLALGLLAITQRPHCDRVRS